MGFVHGPTSDPVQEIKPWMWKTDDAAKYRLSFRGGSLLYPGTAAWFDWACHTTATYRSAMVCSGWRWSLYAGTPESGTWEEVSPTYRDLTWASNTLLGLPSSQYGHIPYPFPATYLIANLIHHHLADPEQAENRSGLAVPMICLRDCSRPVRRNTWTFTVSAGTISRL